MYSVTHLRIGVGSVYGKRVPHMMDFESGTYEALSQGVGHPRKGSSVY